MILAISLTTLLVSQRHVSNLRVGEAPRPPVILRG
jgi:hypothetical protein